MQLLFHILPCFRWEAEARRSGAFPDLGRGTCIAPHRQGALSGFPALLRLRPGAVISAKTSCFCWAPSCLLQHVFHKAIFSRVFKWEMAAEFLLWVWYFLCFPGAMKFCLVKKQRNMRIKGLHPPPQRCLETRVQRANRLRLRKPWGHQAYTW